MKKLKQQEIHDCDEIVLISNKEKHYDIVLH